MDLGAAAARSAAVTLLGLAGLHVAWASGSSWPADDRAELADLMAGRAGGSVPSPAQCLAVATLLTSASALVAGGAPRLPPARGPRRGRGGAPAASAAAAPRRGRCDDRAGRPGRLRNGRPDRPRLPRQHVPALPAARPP